jgi:hypothetical protein
VRAAYDPEPNMGRESKRRVQAARERSQADGRRVKSKDGLAAVPPAVVENWELSDALEGQDDQQGQGDQENQLSAQESSPPSLEPHVLERLSGVPVLACSSAVVPPTRGKIAERYPCPSPVADG